jgi:streptogramin lyase
LIGRAIGRLSASKRSFKKRPDLEFMEPRRLLSNTVVEYAVPQNSGVTGTPSTITVGPNGTLWYIEASDGVIGSLSDTSPNPQSYGAQPSAGSHPQDITTSPDGKLWFTELLGNAIGMIDPSSSSPTITLYGTAQGMTAASRPVGIVWADNELWFVQEKSQQIGCLDPTTGNITEYSIPAAVSGLSSQLVLGPDGNLWFTEFGNIGVFSPTSHSMVAQIALPNGSGEAPFGLTDGPDSTVWYSDGVLNSQGNGYASYSVGVISSASQPNVHEIPLASSAEPEGITAALDGNIWVTFTNGTIDSIDPSQESVTQSLSVPTSVESTPIPTAITAGADGNLWFTDAAGAIGEVELGTQLVATTPPPTSVSPGTAIGFVVADEYATGATDTAFNGAVQISLGGSVISSEPAVNGVATFSGITLSQLGPNVLAISSTATINAPAATSATVVVGYSPPPTPPAPRLSPADISGTQTDYTDVNTPILIGTAEPGSTITLYESGVVAPFATATADSNGNYSIPLGSNTPLSLGGYQFTVVASNNQGPSQASPAFGLTVVAPPTTPSAPLLLASESNGAAGGETTTSTSPELVGTTEASVTVQLLNGSGTVLATTQSTSSGSYEIQVPGTLSPGSYPYRVSIIDQYGDVSTPSPAQTITVVSLPTPSPTTPPAPTPTPTPPPTPTPAPPPTPVIIGEVPIFSRKLNHKGVPVGKATLTGFELIFSQPMGGSGLNSGEYRVEKVVAKATRKKPQKVSNVGFSVSYVSANTVMVGVKNQAFTLGGVLTVNGAVSSAAGASLGVTDSFSIGKGGKTITPE